MSLGTIDWILIILYFVFTLVVALRFAGRAGKNIGEFFLGGRKLPWYIAGVSMVATTFAADTPLAVTELTANNGISGNWLWWNMLIGGMLTTFFFARLWRRSGVLTEVEFISIRYSGKPAQWLRGFKSVYLGLFLNVLILAWVNLAFLTLLKVFFGVDETDGLIYTAIAMLIVAGYSAVSGFLGVAITDFVQFIVAMTGSIVLAVVVLSSEQVGGVSGLQEKLAATPEVFSFFPSVGDADAATGVLAITGGMFLAYLGFQWWASWYPGAEPGGGGYVAQRMMSTRSEKDSLWATLFFQVAHYAIRPWPWILVALAAMVLYSLAGVESLDPETAAQIAQLKADGIKLEDIGKHMPAIAEQMKSDANLEKAVTFTFDPRVGYVYAMKDFLPEGLKGLLLVAFLAAYMSTISTQLNWGASYLLNDLYKPFIRPEQSEKHYVMISRVLTLILMAVALYATTLIESISGVWAFLIECGAGLGLVLILRWYWWRINAWSEITATIAPFIAFGMAYHVPFPDRYFITIGFTTFMWIGITYLTSPEPEQKLQEFYHRVRPNIGWKKFGGGQGGSWKMFGSWLSGIALVYSALFAFGGMIFGEWDTAIIWLGVLLASAALLYYLMKGKSPGDD